MNAAGIFRPRLLVVTKGVTKAAAEPCASWVSVCWCGPSSNSLRSAIELIPSHGVRHIAAGTRDVLDVALLVHRFTVFVGRKISRQIYWFAAKFAEYVCERVTTHNASFGRSQVASATVEIADGQD